jgi:translation elongation factor P/translation initiation factor 5A
MESELTKIPIEELEDYGYIYIRNEPCRIVEALRQQNASKHGKSDEPGRLRWQIEAVQAFTGEEVFKGIVKDEMVEVPVFEKKKYDVIFVSNGDAEIRVMDPEDEECEELTHLELPLEENMPLVERIRKAANSDEDILVETLTCMGREVIINMEYSEDD